MNLSELKVGQSAVVKNVGGEGALRQHFLDMGVIPGVGVTVVKFAPLGDPVEIKVHDYELTLRMSEAAQIEVGNVLEKGETDDGQSLVRRAVNDIKNLRREERETWDEQQADDIDNKDGKKLCKREHGKSPHGKTERSRILPSPTTLELTTKPASPTPCRSTMYSVRTAHGTACPQA